MAFVSPLPRRVSARLKIVAAHPSPQIEVYQEQGPESDQSDDDADIRINTTTGYECVCSCGPGAWYRLASTKRPGRRHYQLNVLGMTQSEQDALDATKSYRISSKHYSESALAGKAPLPDMRWSRFGDRYLTVSVAVGARMLTPSTVAPGEGTVSEVLSALHEELGDSRLAAAARSVATLEAEIATLRKAHAARSASAASPSWAPVEGGGFSPRLRLAFTEANPELCRELFGFAAPVIRSVADLLAHCGDGKGRMYAPGDFRAAVASSAVAAGVDKAHPLLLTAAASVHPELKGQGGVSALLDVHDRVAMTLYGLRNALHFKKIGWLYDIGKTTASSYFVNTITGLDKLFQVLYPPKIIDWWRCITPKASETKMGGRRAVAALDCMETKLFKPSLGWLNGERVCVSVCEWHVEISLYFRGLARA